MVWLTWPSPSLLSARVQACGRLPSAELALVRDAVRERARRVMLAEGTVGRDGTGCERPHGSRAPAGRRGLAQAKRPARPGPPTAQRPSPSQGSSVCSVRPQACNASDSAWAGGHRGQQDPLPTAGQSYGQSGVGADQSPLSWWRGRT